METTVTKYHWGYTHENGPHKWGNHFPLANGDHQSPIDIDTCTAAYDDRLVNNELKINWTSNLKEVKNTGNCFAVETEGDESTIEGGPLPNPYSLIQFHMHWGPDCHAGSEHTVDGKVYAAELHFVHMNTARYTCFTKAAAAQHHEGLAVIGILVELGDKRHPAFDHLIAEIGDVEYRGSSKHVKSNFDPSDFLPEDTTSYWTYPGSLTTPPCYESVQWILLKEPIQVTADQLGAFRRLRHSAPDEAEQHQIVVNYRPPALQNDRKVRATFETNGQLIEQWGKKGGDY